MSKEKLGWIEFIRLVTIVAGGIASVSGGILLIYQLWKAYQTDKKITVNEVLKAII